jgi:hypothetical protein
MAKERLSKLQKWILSTALKNEGGLYRRDISPHYFGKKTPSGEVSIARSIRNLVKKGYIEARCYPTITGEEMMVAYVMSHEELTEADIEKYAKTLPVKKRFEFTVTSINEHAKGVVIKEIYLTPGGERKATEILNIKKKVSNKDERR